MTGIQFFFQFLLCRLFLDLGIVQRNNRPQEVKSWKQYCKSGEVRSQKASQFSSVVPNGVSTGLDIGFSNLSLKTISLSFYTMCKSTTPMFLLFFAFIWKLERPSWGLAGIMGVITSGILLLVYGETKFNFIGFSLVMVAACLAGLRWTLTQVFLQGGDSSHIEMESGPLDLLEKLTPIMSGIVLFVSLCFENWPSLSNSHYFENFEQTMLTLLMVLFIGLIAFLMVWTEFKVIKETSALTFMVAGTCKEIVTVMAAVAFFHDDFGIINGIGLAILLFGVSLFNVHKYQKLKKGEIKMKQPQFTIRNGTDLHRESETQMTEVNGN
eukprot:g8074.t2